MSGIRIEGNTSGHVAEVDANNNLIVVNTLVDEVAGFVTVQCEIDDGTAGSLVTTTNRTIRQPTASIFNRQSIGLDTVLFSDYFNATSQNTALWSNTNTTFTIGFGTGGYNVFNASLITTTGATQILKSYRTFSMFGQTPVMFEYSEFRSAVPATNQQTEAGLFLSGGTPFTPTDGVYFRHTSNGVFGVINYNGTETVTQLLTAGQMVINDNTSYRIVVNHYRVEFWGASTTSAPRILLGEIGVPSANGPAFSSLNAPASFRMINTGTAGSAVGWKVANCVVTQMDVNLGAECPDLMNGMGIWPQQGFNGGTMGSTALYTNSLAAGAGAVMTNTTAALGTGFGGQFSYLPTLAAGTDGVLCSFQNPASTVTQTGRTIFIQGVRIQGVVSTVLAGNATPVIMLFALGVGGTNVSLATAESATAKARRAIPLGIETYGAAAALGTVGSQSGVYMQFQAPIPVNAGEFVQIIAKNIGVVTTSGVITTLVTFDAYAI